MRITIRSWRDFQHYKERRPPWIKVYRTILDNREWSVLPDSAARLLVECWLLASESEDGTIEVELNDLAWRLRKPDASKMLADLNALRDKDFVSLASDALANDTHDDRPEGEGKEKVERETKSDGEKSGDCSTAFEQWWSQYPRKIEKMSAFRAWKARLQAGATIEEMTEGLKRYVKYIAATGFKVKYPATFLGPDKHWEEEYRVQEKAVGTQGGAEGAVLPAKFSEPMEPIFHERPTPPSGETQGNVGKLAEGLLERAKVKT